MINALDSLAVTKIDVLDTLSEIPVCVDYKYKGSVLREFPADSEVLGQVEPVYKNLKGWQSPLAGITEWSRMPAAAQDYIKFLSDYLGVPISMISTGSHRNETVRLHELDW